MDYFNSFSVAELLDFVINELNYYGLYEFIYRLLCVIGISYELITWYDDTIIETVSVASSFVRTNVDLEIVLRVDDSVINWLSDNIVILSLFVIFFSHLQQWFAIKRHSHSVEAVINVYCWSSNRSGQWRQQEHTSSTNVIWV